MMMELNKENIRKAYKELYEIINNFTEEEVNKIPKTFISNIKTQMDEKYEFKLDYTKDLSQQNLMNETKSMLVNLYKMFFANEEEKIFFQKYDKLCFEKVEEKKHEKYNPDTIFNKQIQNQEISLQEEKQEMIIYKHWFFRIFYKIKQFFKKHLFYKR